MRSVESIVKLLNQYQQRATYGAVAGLFGAIPRSLMQGRKRGWLNSWVVNQETGLPTEYPEPLIHPMIAARERIISSSEELAAWLDNPD